MGSRYLNNGYLTSEITAYEYGANRFGVKSESLYSTEDTAHVLFVQTDSDVTIKQQVRAMVVSLTSNTFKPYILSQGLKCPCCPKPGYHLFLTYTLTYSFPRTRTP